MITKAHKILIGLLVAQIALTVLVFMRGDRGAALEEKPLIAGFDAAKVTRVQIFGGEARDKPIDLVKRGNDWVLASSFDYPVAAQKVTDLLTPFGKIAAAEPIATQSSHHKQMKVADAEFERKLVITGSGPELTVYVGASTQRRTPVRFGTEQRVWGVSGLTAYSINTTPAQWVDTQYLSIKTDDVTKVTVQRGANVFDVERAVPPAAGSGSGSGSGSAGSGSAAPPAPTWVVKVDNAPLVLAKGESVNTTYVEDLVADVSSLDMTAPGDPKRDASKPDATVTIARKGGAPVTLDFVVDGESYWVAERGRGKAAIIAKAKVDNVFEVAKEKLVNKPAPKGEGSGSGSAAPPMDMPPDMPPMDMPMPPMQ